jgi:hypothetical protein
MLYSFIAWSRIPGYSWRLAGSRSFVALRLSAWRLSGEGANSSARFFDVRRPDACASTRLWLFRIIFVCHENFAPCFLLCPPYLSLPKLTRACHRDSLQWRLVERFRRNMSICGRLVMNIQHISMTTSSRDRHPHRNLAGRAGGARNCH